jgi:hypothetical protein
MKRTILLLGLLLTLSIAAAQSPTNPPPTTKLSGHVRYEIQPLQMGAPYAGQEANEKAKAKIQEFLSSEIGPLLELWNQAAAASAESQTTLVLFPEVQSIKFISGGKRFWTGAFSGSSHVILKLTLREQPAGTVIGDPQFYQRANAVSGAWTFGAQDNDMLRRIVVVLKSYLEANYNEAVGGASGYES